jgi:hypothetical protein
MAHPLDGALAHVGRADRDFDELKSLLEKFVGEEEQKALAYYNLARLKYTKSLRIRGIQAFNFPGVPFEAAVLVSAIIHHLRAAFDYLVYELALHDSGIVQNGTQFIIEDVKADSQHPDRGFDARATSKLRGLTETHVAMIEDLQPYKRGKWTAALRDISNSDKHRKLTVISGSHIIARSISIGPRGSFEGRPGPTGKSLSGGPDIRMDVDSSVYVGFPERDNIPVLQTLEILKGKVRVVIDSFKAEF